VNAQILELHAALASANAELYRRERALRTFGACNEALVRAGDEQALLDAVCRLVVEIGGYAACWVGLAEGDDRGTVRPVARAGREEGSGSPADLVRAERECADGVVRRAIRTRLPSLVRSASSSEAPERPRRIAGRCASILARRSSPTGRPGRSRHPRGRAFAPTS
jgi:hypothetical protein